MFQVPDCINDLLLQMGITFTQKKHILLHQVDILMCDVVNNQAN